MESPAPDPTALVADTLSPGGGGAHWSVRAARVGLLAALAWVGLFHFSVVRGSSMSPSIHDGDRIVVDHFSYVLGDVRRGDVVILRYPLDPTLDYVKRVIGLPGEEVRLERGRVWIDGVELDEPYLESTDPTTHMRCRVAPDSYFVLGDNRMHSSDSREFGLVPRELLVGRVDLRVWPLQRLGPIR